MQQFRIKPGGFKEIKKQLLIRTVPMMLIAAVGGIVISSVTSKGKESDINTLPFLIPIVLLALGFGLYRGINRQKTLYESYILTLTDNLIERTRLNTVTISIYFNEIREIIKTSNGDFIIKGKNAADIITVPRQIENYDQLENSLVQIKSITTKSNDAFIQRYGFLLSFLTIGLMFAVYTVTNKIIVAISGLTLIVLLSWSFIEVRKSKNIDAKTKRSMWWVLICLKNPPPKAVVVNLGLCRMVYL